MERYIDANKYKADLLVGQEYLDEDTLLTAINLLDCQPTADVQEVRHGTPVPHYTTIYDIVVYNCPFCGELVFKNYCPNCDAKMDEEEN